MPNDVGTPIKHLRGSGTFVDDIFLPGMAYAGFVRSPYAHALIRNVNFEKVGSKVILCLIGEEASKYSKPIPTYLYSSGDVRIPEWNCIASKQVNFVGEPVAAVVCANRYDVEDAVEDTDVDYELLPPIVDSEIATKDDSNLVHKYLGSNIAVDLKMSGGDLGKAKERTDFVITRKFKVHRHATASMETRGGIASFEPSSMRLTLWASTQIPFILRSHLAQLLGVPERNIRVIAPDVGGGFGAKLQLSAEYIALCILSMLLKRPIKWIETRSENLLAFAHAREQVHVAEAGFSADGHILWVKDRALMDAGAYLDSRISGQAMCSFYELQGPYKLEAVDAQISIVLTNKCPYGAYRGFGLETGALIIERLMDIAAKKLDLDPSVVRERNLIGHDDMSYKTALGLVYGINGFHSALHSAMEVAGYTSLRKWQLEEKAKGRRVGIGLSVIVEPSSTNAYTGVVAPGELTASVDFGGAFIKMDSEGGVTVHLGTVSLGTNHYEAVATIVSDQLGLDRKDVLVVEGDTATTPYDCGVRASRFSTVVLPAIIESVQLLKQRLVKAAASMLEANELDVELKNRMASVKGSSNMKLRIEDVANMFYANTEKLPLGLEPSLEINHFFKPLKKGAFNAFSYAVHIPVVELDKDTGVCRFLKYVIFEDCGKIINKEVVDGQLQGGLAQVVGGIFFEEMKYDDGGQLLTSSFLDYLIPSSREVPVPIISHTITQPSLSAVPKGMGESSIIAGYAAILNAMSDVLDSEVNNTHLPPEELWRIQRSRNLPYGS